MNALDWVIIAIVLLSTVIAAAQGFFFEVFSLAGAIGGYLLAAWGYGLVAPWFLPYVKSASFADLAGFLTIFFAVLLLAGATARIARWAMREAGLRWADRFLGGAFGLVRSVIIITVGLMALTAFVPESSELAGSQLAGYFLVAGRAASWIAPSTVRHRFRLGMDKLRQGATAVQNATKPGK
ncbi:MAG TPA: CvpA family protein [Candidatus Angelobacter sp.]|nr:CvpA family protein [Candidatus Angelobacter sp.]